MLADPGLNFPVRALDFQKMEIRDRFTCTQCTGAFFGWVVNYRCGLLEKILGKLALFEKFRSSGKEEARPGGGFMANRMRRSGVNYIACINSVRYSLHQLCSLQHNALRFMIDKFRAGELHSSH